MPKDQDISYEFVRSPHSGDIALAGVACLMLAFFCDQPVWAAEANAGNGIALRWDNTIKYTAMFRVGGRDAALISDRNGDDGDRNFAKDIVSNRFDLLSQLDVSKGGFGVDASVAFWYDTVYQRKNDNNSPQTFNPLSVPHDEFTHAVEQLHGAKADLVNAFFYGETEFLTRPLSFRIGRHTLLWGESVFFTDNGIAAGQAPIDQIKALRQPTAYARDVFLPVAQVSASAQLPDNFSVDAYYQFEWRKTRLPGSGSYLSSLDYIDTGGERWLLRDGKYYLRSRDRMPSGLGQFGAALRWSTGDIDYGLYALRFNAKDPEIYYRRGIITQTDGSSTIVDPSIIDLSAGKIGTYHLVYPENIQVFGASASGYVGNSNVAVELSGRRNMPLASEPLFEVFGQTADANKNPLYAVGDTVHAQLSTITTLGRNSLWDRANLNVEVAANARVAVTKNRSALDSTSDPASVAFRGSFDFTYFEVLPSLNITPNIGLGFNLAGTSSINRYQNNKDGAGDLDLGITLTYRVVWSATMMFTHYLGPPNRQPLADRDFIGFSIERTF